MERRAWARQAVELSAVYETASIKPQPCRLRDYCPGGLLLESETPLSGLLVPGKEISIGMSLQINGAVTAFQLRGTVRRVHGHQFGVQFHQDLDPVARHAFEAAALQYRQALTQQPRAAIPGAQRTAVVSSVLDSFADWWPSVIRQLVPKLEQALMQAASAAKNNKDIDACFQAMNVLRRNSEQFTQAYVEEFRRQVRKPEAVGLTQLAPAEEGLALVDTNAFEDWLLVSGVGARIEAAHAHALTPLRDGLSVVYGLPIGADNNPAGPRVLASLFMKVFGGVFSSETVRHIAFEQFGNVVTASLGEFLQPVTAKLEQTGITRMVKTQTDAPRRRSLATRPVSKPQAQPAEQAQAIPEGRAAPRHPRASAPAATTGLPPAPVAPQYTRERGTLGSLYQLRESAPRAAAALPAETARLMEELLGLLAAGSVSSDAAGGKPLARLIEERLAQVPGGPRALAPEQRLPVDLTDAIFEQLSDDRRVAPELREGLDKLRLPLLRTMLRDPGFMDDRKHPARQLVNQFVRLGAQEGPGARGLHKTLDGHLQRIDQEYERNPAVLTEVLAQLNELVDTQNKAYQRNLQRVQATREGQEKLHQARQRVARELLEVTGGRRVPMVFRRLIEENWRNFLVLMLLKHGEASEQWQDYQPVPGQLITLLRSFKRSRKDKAAAEFAARIEALLEVLTRGLVEGGEDLAESRRRATQIRNLLLQRLGAAESAALLALEQIDPDMLDAGDAPPDAAAAVDRSDAARAIRLRRVRRMAVGEGLILAPGSAEEQRLILAWRAEDASSLVFVNERGLEARKYLCDELVAEFAEKRAVVVPGEEMPAVDRGVLAMIQKVYQDVADAAARDGLTGLFNRRKFEGILEKALLQARQEGVSHVLCYLNLDQLKMLNARYGPEAGDDLLRTAAATLTGFAREGQVEVAHLGGDEFGLLLSGATAAAAMPLLEKYRAAVARASFRWTGDTVNLSGAWALVEITARSESVNSLLKAAYHTCTVAKAAGPNRVHVYAETDTAIRRRKSVVDWASRIGRMLERNEFRLRVQKIAPLRPDDHHEHNEVLLSVVMKDGELRPVPADLIQAAEAYGLMPRIDRWVVDKSLDWMAANPALVQQIGGLAVNLSGASLTDPQLIDFVLGKIASSGVDTGKLCFEVTETSMIKSLDQAADFIAEAKRLGCSFALDDFGSGMSSYAYLKNLPVDYLKIDGVFIRDIASSRADYAMVKSINEIAHFLGKKTIAEYVENEGIVRVLMEIGVDYAQGYVIEKPYYLSELSA